MNLESILRVKREIPKLKPALICCSFFPGTKLPTIDNVLDGELAASCANLGSDLEPLDPVFSPNYCQIEGVKHAGKARRGDGNDLTG